MRAPTFKVMRDLSTLKPIMSAKNASIAKTKRKIGVVSSQASGGEAHVPTPITAMPLSVTENAKANGKGPAPPVGEEQVPTRSGEINSPRGTTHASRLASFVEGIGSSTNAQIERDRVITANRNRAENDEQGRQVLYDNTRRRAPLMQVGAVRRRRDATLVHRGSIRLTPAVRRRSPTPVQVRSVHLNEEV